MSNIVDLVVIVTLLQGLHSAPADLSETCFCHGLAYDRSREPYRYDDCTSCTNCGEIIEIDCIVGCADPLPDVENDGVCCSICPHGNNCLAEGEIIPVGPPVRVGDYMCECEPVTLGYNPENSQCIPAPPMI